MGGREERRPGKRVCVRVCARAQGEPENEDSPGREQGKAGGRLEERSWRASVKRRRRRAGKAWGSDGPGGCVREGGGDREGAGAQELGRRVS